MSSRSSFTYFSERFRKPLFIILLLMYMAGFIGLQIKATQAIFQALSPFNLWFSLFALLAFQKNANRSFWLFCFFIYLLGFGVEVLGVKTGAIFGEYHYGNTLGLKLFDVPLTIGANWLLLTICTGSFVSNWSIPNYLKAFVAAILMVSLDFLIEPVAPSLDFWYWANNDIPLQNYVAWFGLSFVAQFLYFSFHFTKDNAMAILLLVLQFLFFVGHYISIFLKSTR